MVSHPGETNRMSSTTNPFLERGIAFKQEGRYDEAQSELNTLLEQDVNSSEGHHQLGLVLGFVGDFDQSIEELQRAVILSPARIDMRLDLAKTFTMLGMYDEAESEFNDILQREPENKAALENLKFIKEPV